MELGRAGQKSREGSVRLHRLLRLHLLHVLLLVVLLLLRLWLLHVLLRRRELLVVLLLRVVVVLLLHLLLLLLLHLLLHLLLVRRYGRPWLPARCRSAWLPWRQSCTGEACTMRTSLSLLHRGWLHTALHRPLPWLTGCCSRESLVGCRPT